MIWLLIAFLIFILLIMPLGIRIRYESNGLTVSVVIGPFRLALYPTRKKESTKVKNKTDKPAAAKEKKSGDKGGSIKDFLPLLRIVLDFLEDFRGKLRVDNLHLKLILGGTDPCDLSINYGRGWAVLGNLLPLIEQAVVIKKRDLEIECDYTLAETTVVAGADITITLARTLSLASVHGFRALKALIKISNKRKGGAKT